MIQYSIHSERVSGNFGVRANYAPGFDSLLCMGMPLPASNPYRVMVSFINSRFDGKSMLSKRSWEDAPSQPCGSQCPVRIFNAIADTDGRIRPSVRTIRPSEAHPRPGEPIVVSRLLGLWRMLDEPGSNTTRH